jgi:hypothetical protein
VILFDAAEPLNPHRARVALKQRRDIALKNRALDLQPGRAESLLHLQSVLHRLAAPRSASDPLMRIASLLERKRGMRGAKRPRPIF